MAGPFIITPGTVLVHRTGTIVVVSHRKRDGSGWWMTDRSGLADSVLASSWGTEWIDVPANNLRDLFTVRVDDERETGR